MKKKNEVLADNLMSVSDYAKAHGKSLAWGYKQVNNNKVESRKIGKTVFVVC